MSLSSSLARALTRAALAARDRRIREKKRLERERQRAINKAAKERFIARRKNEAEVKSKELLDSYKKYQILFRKVIDSNSQFSFNALKKEFTPTTFEFSKPFPEKHIPALRKVPKEIKLEDTLTFLKKRRLSIIDWNNDLIRRVEEKYKIDVDAYNCEKENARLNWDKEENSRYIDVKKHNADIDQWAERFKIGDRKAIERFAQNLLETHDYSEGIVKQHRVRSNDNKELFIEFDIIDREEIFAYSGYKYMIQRDEFRPIKMTVSDLNKYTKDLLCEVANTIVATIYKNNIGNVITGIIVNGDHNNICCSSTKVRRDGFQNYVYVEGENICPKEIFSSKVYSQIDKGIKPYVKF
jgi:hypothetical protein